MSLPTRTGIESRTDRRARRSSDHFDPVDHRMRREIRYCAIRDNIRPMQASPEGLKVGYKGVCIVVDVATRMRGVWDITSACLPA